MVGILLVSHGGMAAGIKSSIEMIFGSVDRMDIESLAVGQDFNQFKKNISDKIDQLDNGDGVLVFVDLFGASPYNASLMNYKELADKKNRISIITGMNLPMILEVCAAGSKDLHELTNIAITSGKTGIQNAIENMEKAEAVQEDDDY